MKALDLVFGLLALFAAQAGMACSGSGTPEDVVQAQVEAYNAHDVDAFAACFSDAIELHDLSGERPMTRGLDGLRTAYAFLREMPDEFRVEILQRVVSDSIVVDHERVHGMPGESGVLEAVAIYEVRDGRIVKLWFPPAR